MVRRHFIGIPLLAVALASNAQMQSGQRKIERLMVREIGKSQNQKDQMAVSWCRNFKPTPQQLRKFFLKAYPVPGAFMVDDYYSDCYATGEIAYNDPKSFGSWTLYSTGVAKIEWAFGGAAYVLYRNNKWRDPMAE